MELGGQKWLYVALVLVLAVFHIEATRIGQGGEVAFNLHNNKVQQRDLSKNIYYGMKPKGVPLPPSGPSKRTSDSPPPPPHHRFNHALVKGPVPPSAPNQRTYDSPPPPPHHRFNHALVKGPVPPLPLTNGALTLLLHLLIIALIKLSSRVLFLPLGLAKGPLTLLLHLLIIALIKLSSRALFLPLP
ncbi:hypothetical protein I3842_06G178000 [Carya illinoinensis]|uniref:Uncharacterized protein n=1 Tax=Carya illinoinensis TaxID=32201 RepID=A0A922EYX4_CARIL|nr:hypothetical protein I3842_06G178000 [Carya illinoinensis]